MWPQWLFLRVPVGTRSFIIAIHIHTRIFPMGCSEPPNGYFLVAGTVSVVVRRMQFLARAQQRCAARRQGELAAWGCAASGQGKACGGFFHCPAITLFSIC